VRRKTMARERKPKEEKPIQVYVEVAAGEPGMVWDISQEMAREYAGLRMHEVMIAEGYRLHDKHGRDVAEQHIARCQAMRREIQKAPKRLAKHEARFRAYRAWMRDRDIAAWAAAIVTFAEDEQLMALECVAKDPQFDEIRAAVEELGGGTLQIERSVPKGRKRPTIRIVRRCDADTGTNEA
jgi:hypothetical protein